MPLRDSRRLTKLNPSRETMVTTVVSVIAALAGYDKLMPKGGSEGGT